MRVSLNVNYMSNFAGSPSGDISEWNASISMLLEQGYPPSTISLAIPYFFGNTPWADMCASCPDIAPASNNCSGTLIVGKLMNQRLGALAVMSMRHRRRVPLDAQLRLEWQHGGLR